LTGLAQAYWAQAEQEIEQKKDQEAQVALQAAAPYLQEAVKNAVQSTEIANPNNSFNWAFRAQIYRKLIGVDEGFDDWALNMYEKAIKLETSNPTLYNEVGQVYLIKNDLEKAKLAFEKAVELMPQYIDAHYYLALIADKKGDRAAAIGHLEIVGQLLTADDAASRENIEKAIDTLRRGGSISSPAAESTPAAPPASGAEIPPAAGPESNNESVPENASETAESAPEDVLPPEPAAVND
jgi:cytochrome c-type biogenesis protein CcmH/NrfG